MQGATVLKWWQNRRSPDSVAVNLSFCGKTRVEIVRHISTAEHANGWRQQCIERFDPTGYCQLWANEIDMCALREGVDACVRPPGPVNAHRRSGDALKRAFEMILNGIAVRLTLPAGKRRAVVSDDYF